MVLFYEIYRYSYLLITLVAVIIAFTWKAKKGKGLMCTFFLLNIFTFLISYIIEILIKRDFTEQYDMRLINILDIINLLLRFMSLIILLLFVIVVRKNTVHDIKVDHNILNDITNLTNKEKRSILQRREWTYILDSIFISIICFLIGLVIGFISGPYDNPRPIAFLLGFFISSLYALFKDSFSGKSLGKLLTGLRVVDINSGQPIGIDKSIIRNWIFLVPLFPLVELIVANVREDKRRLGDLLANTIVIKDNKKREYQIDSTNPLHTSVNEKNEEARDETPSFELENAQEQYIHFKCQCGQRVKIPRKFAGKVGRCPKCSESINVPKL